MLCWGVVFGCCVVVYMGHGSGCPVVGDMGHGPIEAACTEEAA